MKSQISNIISHQHPNITKCFNYSQIKKNTTDSVRKLACFCSMITFSILSIPIYFPRANSTPVELISFTLECCWRGLKILYVSMAQKMTKSPDGPSSVSEPYHATLIVSYLQQMRMWESGEGDQSRRGRPGDLWFEKSWSHLLHSFFILLNSYFSALAVKIKRDVVQPISFDGHENFMSQLSQTSQTSDFSVTSTSSQNGKKSQKGRKKRKRASSKTDDCQGHLEGKEEDQQSKLPTPISSTTHLTDILAEAQEYKTFCRKSRVGSLYEVTPAHFFVVIILS